MAMVQVAWLAVLTAGLWVWTVRDMREYRLFRTIDDGDVRARYFLRWTWRSFALLTGASVVTLWLAGMPSAPFAFPDAFQPLRSQLDPLREPSGDWMVGLLVGMAVSLTIGGVVQYRRIKRLLTPVMGDVEPMIPRTGREMLAAVPLCLNAGFSEELFFRCALPLLVLSITGSLWIALGLSVAAFGLIHAYQGWKGVAATTVAGAVLTLIYLSSGSLLRVMALHAAIDLIAMIVRPALTRLIARRRGPLVA